MRKRDPRYAEVGAHKPANRAKTFRPKDSTFDREQGACACPARQTLKLNSANVIIPGRQATVFKGTSITARPVRCAGSACCKPDVTAARQVAFFEGGVASRLPNPHCRPMREKIDGSRARSIHAHRMGLIEPAFGRTQQRGRRRFTLRGQARIDARWKLFCIVHYMAKLQL